MIAEKLWDLEANVTAARSLGYRCATYRSLAHLGERLLKQNDSSHSKRQEIEELIAENNKEVRRLTLFLSIGQLKKLFIKLETLCKS